MQVDTDGTCSVPFLGLNEKKKLLLFPLGFLHQEAPSAGDQLWMENRCASSKSEFPLKKWVHVGCEVYKLTASDIHPMYSSVLVSYMLSIFH